MNDETTPTDAVGHHIPCRGCGYDLRGLAVAGACPECAMSVARSLRGDLLRHAPVDETAAIRRGLRIVAFAGRLGLIGIASGLSALLIVPWIVGAPKVVENALLVLFVVGLGMLVLAWVAGIAGFVTATVRDPAESVFERRVRLALRVAAGAVVGSSVALFVVVRFPPLLPAPGGQTVVTWGCALAWLLSTWILLAAATLRLRRIAERTEACGRESSLRPMLDLLVRAARWLPIPVIVVLLAIGLLLEGVAVIPVGVVGLLVLVVAGATTSAAGSVLEGVRQEQAAAPDDE